MMYAVMTEQDLLAVNGGASAKEWAAGVAAISLAVAAFAISAPVLAPATATAIAFFGADLAIAAGTVYLGAAIID